MSIQILSVGLSLFILLFSIELTRREKLTFKYAITWIVLGLLAVFLSGLPKLLFRLSSFFGFCLPSNFIFFIVSCSFVLLSLLLTIFLCQQNERNDRIAQKIGLLEFELERLRKAAEKISG